MSTRVLVTLLAEYCRNKLLGWHSLSGEVCCHDDGSKQLQSNSRKSERLLSIYCPLYWISAYLIFILWQSLVTMAYMKLVNFAAMFTCPKHCERIGPMQRYLGTVLYRLSYNFISFSINSVV